MLISHFILPKHGLRVNALTALFRIGFWLLVIGLPVSVFSRWAGHKWYHRVAVTVGFTILTGLFILIFTSLHLLAYKPSVLLIIWPAISSIPFFSGIGLSIKELSSLLFRLINVGLHSIIFVHQSPAVYHRLSMIALQIIG